MAPTAPLQNGVPRADPDPAPALAHPGALLRITREMLAHNPFVPPAGCPVNALPPELLAHIFVVGTQMEAEEWDDVDEDDDEEDDDEEDGDEEDDEDDEDGDGEGVEIREWTDEDGAMDVDGDGASDGSAGAGALLPFQVLVSHVCRHWRAVAVETPALWTRLTFAEGAPYEQSRAWIQRAKGGPLDIDIDCTFAEDGDECGDGDEAEASSLSGSSMASSSSSSSSHGCRCAAHCTAHCPIPDLGEILDIVVPLVAQWRSFDVTTGTWKDMHMLLSRLSACASAPLLETLGLYHCDDNEDYETFRPAELREPFLIFHGNAPKLRDVLLWGVHLDWDRSLPLLSDLRDLKLSYHAEDVRPSFATFAQILNSSPDLRSLDLCLSGPRAHDGEHNDWGTAVIEMPALTDLVFCYHKCAYAVALLKRLSVPHVHNLALDFDEEDYTDFVKQLTLPMAKTGKSILAGLEHMKISGLPCNRAGIERMLAQLAGLKTLNINCSNEEEQEIFRQLAPAGGASARIFCPNLYKIIATGVSGAEMCSFIKARNAAGVPIKQVMMSEEDEIEEGDIRWLREHVEELDFFEPSDEEYEDEDEDVDEDEEFPPWYIVPSNA
ncbi:hypothetical protein C0993_004171 [Termitomyces sp. T159_Od127]|nr:hypothetical protein C0993_004171 [Termitomyces sp. T159_Od127]